MSRVQMIMVEEGDDDQRLDRWLRLQEKNLKNFDNFYHLCL